MLEFEHSDSPLEKHARDLILCPEGTALRIEMFVFEQDDGSMRCLFKHGSFDVAEELKALLDDQAFFRRPAQPEAERGEQKLWAIYR